MDSSFRDFRDRIIVIYLDDLTVFSKERKNHLKDLRAVLQCCREHGISLNPKKSVFCVTEGKLLGHIVSKEGIKIDPERVNAIQQLSLPSNRTGVRSFFNSAVKSILTRQEVGLNKRVTWVTKIQEYDLDIRPTKTIKGQGLCKLIPENKVETDEELPLTLFVGLQDTWFSDIAYYLTYGICPSHLSTKEQRNLKLKAAKYVIWQDVLYKKVLDGTYLRCVDKPKQRKLLGVYHNEACSGHFSSSVTAFKIIRNCFY
ncbi:uncharacterized protein LOC131859359 [Cryptomeria japonica]|uniref:uncharacterized protein LOC131859359 n=1 Tax=Cryptomeria japonica TaxID=3369 RepID=UPI0027DA9597|nr:uncharacterized protein LOC131859359 [Cryptomeria japonica]